MKAPLVDAHAALLRSTPAANQVVTQSPERITLAFSEVLEPDLVSIKLYDSQATPLNLSKPQLVSGDATQAFVSIPTLDEGTYTVVWSVVSEDGHPVSSSYTFSVGTPSDQVAAPGSAQEKRSVDSVLILLRYVMEGIILIGGGSYLLTFLTKPQALPLPRALVHARRIGWALLLVSVLSLWAVYSFYISQLQVFTQLLSGNFTLLAQSPFLLMLLAILALMILLALPDMVENWYLVMWFLLIGALALGGHVWSSQVIWLAMMLRVIHVVAIAAWIGALGYLVVLRRFLPGVVVTHSFQQSFLIIIWWSAILTIASGFFLVMVQTGWQQVFAKYGMWGVLVTSKSLGVIFMLILAYFQRKKLQQSHSFTPIPLYWELGLGSLLLLFGVWMSQIQYPV